MAYRVRESPLKAETVWSLEPGELVRRSGAAEQRWPLSGLTRMTLRRRAGRYGAQGRMAEMRFGRRRVGFTSQGWRGVGRPEDHAVPFGLFVRRLAAEAARHAPAARFEVGGRASAPAALYWIAALLGAAIAAMIAMALSARLIGLGLDLGGRLLFVLILMFAVAPWLPGPASRAFDPLAVPDDLAPLA